jgi:hypothetical protein
MRTASTVFSILVFVIAFGDLRAQEPTEDAFGGDKRVIGTKRDRFHIEIINGRHWLVTPEGYGFVALGVNHLADALPSGGRGLTREEVNTRRDVVANQLRSWGYTNFGYDTPISFWPQMPYFASVTLTRCSHALGSDKFAYDDVFSETFQAAIDRTIGEACKRAAHPALIGYYWTDTPRWDLEVVRARRGTDWVSALRSMSADKPGKKRYIQFLQEIYGNDAVRFNASYGLSVGKIDHLLHYDFREFDRERAAIKADDRAFLRIIARRLYTITADSFRKHDPGRLLFGERYKQGDHPDEVLTEAAAVVDVISIQPGPETGPLPGPGGHERTFDANTFDRIHRLTKKPILICDHQCSFRIAEQPTTLWHQAETEEGAARLAVDFFHAALAKPYIIGYQRCQYIDRYVADRSLHKQGLIGADGKPHEKLVRLLSAGNREAVPVRLR